MGSEWFLSYHSPDQALARRLKDAIERKAPASRVFFGPTELRAGGFWSPQLVQGIADASAFILLVGEHGIGNWQVLEYNEALDKRVRSPDFPIVLLLLEGQAAPGLPFLRQLHWIVTPDPSSDKAVARLLDATAGGDVSPREQWRYTSPYRGLAAMNAKDSDYFFGRERETIGVIEALATARGKLPLLLGNSGVGKSSLAEAGVPRSADATVLAAHRMARHGRRETATAESGAEAHGLTIRMGCVRLHETIGMSRIASSFLDSGWRGPLHPDIAASAFRFRRTARSERPLSPESVDQAVWWTS